jgi:Ca2+-transporting ATPase
VSAYGVVITGATLGVFVWGLEVRELDTEHAVTLAFMTLALAQLLHVFNARSTGPVLWNRRFFQNPWVWGAIGLTVGLQLMAVYLPLLSDALHTRPLTWDDWQVVLAVSAIPLAVGQARKSIWGRPR